MGKVRNVLCWSDTKTSWFEKAYVWLLAGVLFGIALHAPLSVGFGTLWSEQALFIKSWKEILLGVAGLLLVVILTTKKQWGVYRSKLFLYIAGFAAVNIALIPAFSTGVEATLAGILINLRYFFVFALVYGAVRLYPKVVPLFLSAVAGGALIVVVFAALQVTVLPHDILKYIGYGEATIMPFLTVDQNTDFVRINSTLRGPNPLGAYIVIVLAVLLAAWLQSTKRLRKSWVQLILVAGIASAVVLWATYSRSAALGAVIAMGLVLMVAYGGKITKSAWLVIGIAVLVLAGSLVAARDTSFVSHVILHEDPAEGGVVNSNDQHAESLEVGLQRMAMQPLGAGIGSTGSASLHTENPIVIENQYLFVAHETGWIGLALFMAILVMVHRRLWQTRKHWLSLGVFASGIGLSVIGLIQPVWVDDTVSIVWWSLAAMAIALSWNMKAPKKRGRNV